ALDEVAFTMQTVLLAYAAAHTLIWFVVGFVVGTRKIRPWTWIAAAASGVLVGYGLYKLAEMFATIDLNATYITVAFPAVLALLLFGFISFIAFAGAEMGTDDLEWYGREGAWVCVIIVGWIAACGLVFYVPMLVQYLGLHAPRVRTTV